MSFPNFGGATCVANPETARTWWRTCMSACGRCGFAWVSRPARKLAKSCAFFVGASCFSVMEDDWLEQASACLLRLWRFRAFTASRCTIGASRDLIAVMTGYLSLVSRLHKNAFRTVAKAAEAPGQSGSAVCQELSFPSDDTLHCWMSILSDSGHESSCK